MLGLIIKIYFCLNIFQQAYYDFKLYFKWVKRNFLLINFLFPFLLLTCFFNNLIWRSIVLIFELLYFFWIFKKEKKHLIFEEADFNYKDLLKAFKKFDIKGAIVCESPNIEIDTKILKEYYESL